MTEAVSQAVLEADRLGLPLCVKLAAGATAGTIEGYGATFDGPPDSYGDVIMPGAFAKSLADHHSSKTMPALLWTHDIGEPLGRWLEMREDERGLRVEGRLTLDVPRARAAWALARDGALGLSIGYKATQSEHTRQGNRLLKEIKLFEVSLVAIPANSGARITAVKSAGNVSQITNPRAFEEFLREAGFPKAFARAVTNHGFKAASVRRDADDAGLSELARIIRAGTALLNTKGDR